MSQRKVINVKFSLLIGTSKSIETGKTKLRKFEIFNL